MKKIIILCALTCLNSNIFGMLSKCSRAIPKNKLIHIRTCNSRTQFNFPEILQGLKDQQRQTAEQIKLIEMLMANQPKQPTDAYMAMPDRDFPHGNMHKDH
jgi:hypothetical protein